MPAKVKPSHTALRGRHFAVCEGRRILKRFDTRLMADDWCRDYNEWLKTHGWLERMRP